MDAVTVARFVPPKLYGHPIALLPGVFLTVSPRGRDVRAQLTIREPLAADGPCFFNPTTAGAAILARNAILARLGFKPDGSPILPTQPTP